MEFVIGEKNNFIIRLRDHLMTKYGTKNHHLHDDQGYEGKETRTGGYVLTKKPLSIPREITGFCLRKDLCMFPPRTKKEIYDDIERFTERDKKNIDLRRKGEELELTIEEETYQTTAYVEEGYAGSINIGLDNSLQKLKKTLADLSAA